MFNSTNVFIDIKCSGELCTYYFILVKSVYLFIASFAEYKYKYYIYQ